MQLSWSEASQSIEGNYTNINWNLKLISTGHGANIVSSAAKSCTIKFNGTTVFNGTVNIGLSAGQTKTLRSGSNFRINHNSDGKKTFSYSFSQQINITYSGAYIGTKSASGSGTLDTIPRTSSFSLSPSSLSAGSTMSVNITRASSSFTHTVQWKFGNHTNEKTNIATTTSYEIPKNWLDAIPNSTSGTGTVTVTTYNGSTKIGSSSKSFTLNVSSDAVPSIGGFTAERIDGDVPSEWGIYVQGKSKIKLTISGASGIYGSTIKKYSITGGGYSGSTNPYTTGFLKTSGSNSFNGTITDSRSKTKKSTTININVCEYRSPSAKNLSFERCDNTGNLLNEGTFVLIGAQIDYSSCEGHNTVTKSYRYRKFGDEQWINTGYLETESGDVVGADSISPDYTYEIEMILSDAFESTSRILFVPTAKVIMDWKKGGTGMAIGKVAEKDGLEVAWPTYLHQNLQINPKAEGSYGMDVFRANDEGETYRTGFATGKSGNSLCGYVGFYSPDNQVINALYLWEDRTSLEMPLAVDGGGTGATTPSSARTNLGLMKKLWSGNWTSGNITAEGFQDYTLFFLHPYGGAHSIIAMKVGNTLRGIGGQAGDGNQTILTLQATCNGNTLSGLKCFWINHAVSGNHGAKTDVGIADIYGVC